MIQNLLSDVRREDFGAIANELMNHYCVLKRDSRYDSDFIFRFAVSPSPFCPLPSKSDGL